MVVESMFKEKICGRSAISKVMMSTQEDGGFVCFLFCLMCVCMVCECLCMCVCVCVCIANRCEKQTASRAVTSQILLDQKSVLAPSSLFSHLYLLALSCLWHDVHSSFCF